MFRRLSGGSNGIWIGTDNGLYYREGVVRQISAVDSSYSISSLIIDESGNLWIFGSRGIQKYYEGDLLSSAAPECESYTKSDGLISSITDNSSNYIASDGKVYVCCDKGLSILDQNNIYTNDTPPEVRIASVTVDDKEYDFSGLDGEIKVPGDTNRIVVKFSVLSYVNRSDIQVKYHLTGFEDKGTRAFGNRLSGSRIYKPGRRKLYVCADCGKFGWSRMRAAAFL